jgi:MoaA/NifB/PqqE/SkfB family radical SAM enzyme
VQEFRELCGGSHARAWAMTGDVFAFDPLCAYELA